MGYMPFESEALPNPPTVEDPTLEVDEPDLTPEAEIEQMLFEDESRLGDVYRLHTLDGLSPSAVAAKLNIATPGFVYSYRATIDALRDAKYPGGPTNQRGVRSAIRSLRKRNRSALSPETVAILTKRLEEISALIELSHDDDAPVEHLSDQEANSNDLNSLVSVPGIYAFSYGWYLEHPVDEKFNTTLMKIGRADDMGRRIRDHQAGARAHIPEPLVVVRAYRSNGHDLAELERLFHRLLRTAGHDNPRRSIANRRNEVGKEWFLTNEQFLDAIASTLNLRTEYTGQSDFIELEG